MIKGAKSENNESFFLQILLTNETNEFFLRNVVDHIIKIPVKGVLSNFNQRTMYYRCTRVPDVHLTFKFERLCEDS